MTLEPNDASASRGGTPVLVALRLVISLALVSGTACSKRPSPDVAPVVYLCDVAPVGALASPLDLDDPAELVARTRTSWRRERFQEISRHATTFHGDQLRALFPAGFPHAGDAGDASIVDGGEGPCLALSSSLVFIQLFDVAKSPRSLLAELEFEGSDDPADAPYLIELDQGIGRVDLTDAKALARRAFFTRNYVHPMVAEPADDGEGRRTLRASIHRLPATRTLALVAPVWRESIRLHRFELFGLPSLVSIVSDRPGEDPARRFVRSAAVAQETRRSLVLPASSHLTIPVDLPDDEATLRFGAAAIDADPLRLTLDAFGSAQTLRFGWDIRTAEGWQDIEVDLTALAGQRVDLRFAAATPNEDPGGATILIGSPLVEGQIPSAGPSPPDIVLVSLDTVRADRLGLYGNDIDTSPCLDRLGEEAAVFDTVIATSSWTLPSHASVFTGQLAPRHRIDRGGRALHDGLPLLVPALRARGYETVAVTGGGYVAPHFGFARGFDRFLVHDPVNRDDRQRGDRLENAGIALAREVLSAPRRRPLFLFVHTYHAHTYLPASRDLVAVGADPAVIDEQMREFNQLSMLERLAAVERWQHEDGKRALVRQLYDASVRGADALVGELLDAMTGRGGLDKSWMVVFSDHGEELFEHGSVGHGQALFEESVRVPLVVAGPGIRGTSRRVDEVVTLADIAPTLREIAGAPPSRAADGRSLLPLLRGEAVERRPALALLNDGESSVHAWRGSRWKLFAEGPDGSAPVPKALFDLVTDPTEQNNRIEDRADDARALHAALERWLKENERRAAEAFELPRDVDTEVELQALGYVGGK